MSVLVVVHSEPPNASTPSNPLLPQLQSRPITPADVCLILADRIKREKKRIAELVEKVGSVDQEFTEVDMNELNDLKQSVVGCQRALEQAKEERQVASKAKKAHTAGGRTRVRLGII